MSIFKPSKTMRGFIAMHQPIVSKEVKALSLLVDTFDKVQFKDKESAKDLLLIISKRAAEMANDEETFTQSQDKRDWLKSQGIGGFVSVTEL